MMKKLPVLFVVLIIFISSCKKDGANSNTELPNTAEKSAPDGFNYATTKKVDINVRLLSRNNKPVSGVLVSLFSPSNLAVGAELTKVISDANGYVKTSLTIPASLDTLIIDPSYVGLARKAKAYIKNNSLNAVIGGSTGSSGNIVSQKGLSTSSSIRNAYSRSLSALSGSSASASSTVYDYDKSKFDDLGRPKDLVEVDNFDFADLMKQINNTLPERKIVNAKYIATEAPSNLNINSLADVWITFVHEGADYRNALAYYTYPTGHAPETSAEIDSVHLIFPNASIKDGVGEGNMLLGDKVKIGRFKEGTSIGFVILQDAYQKDGSINTKSTKFYTNEALNPEKETLKRHSVLLHSAKEKIFLIGFEDMSRNPESGSDEDFNDLVFYAQSNPVEAISPKDIPYLDDKVIDSDGDGVPDNQDKYPKDRERAYNRFYPSECIWGTIAFEDMWPKEGDYDMNDLVVSYRYKFAMNASNQVVDLTGEYKPLAAGAEFQNGFGVQLPLFYADINKVSGYNLSSNSYVKLAANGLELGQKEPVFIPFDNYRNLFGANSSFVNTVVGNTKISGAMAKVYILFSTPLSDDFTAKAPFNPFMISNLDRGKEIHLVNQKPTTLADLSLLGKGDDTSNPDIGRYYVTKNNKPFALDLFGEFQYPVERKAIYDVYFNFSAWALSGGKEHLNWNENPKERDQNFIYK